MTMPELRHVAAGDLAPILTAFRALPWPCDRAQLLALAEQLGWQVVLDRRKGIDVETGLPVTPDRGNALLPGDGSAVGQVQLYLTDRTDEGAGLDAAYGALVADVTGQLGEPTAVQPARARTSWDLATGGRLSVARLEKVVILDVLGRDYADIERAESAQAIDPDRVVATEADPV